MARSALARLAAGSLTALALAFVPGAQAQLFPEEGYVSPGVPPPGANLPFCPPGSDPVPVVLVHGTFLDMTISWNLLSPALVAEGYCVFALDLVRRGTAAVEESAEKVEDFVDDVLAATGADRVAIVGHSQGGMLPRYFIKNLSGNGKVEDAIGLAPSNHGTNPDGDFLAQGAADNFSCPACEDQISGSSFLSSLNAGDETPGDADYTVIATSLDIIVDDPFLAGGTELTNVLVQDKCPGDTFEHIAFPYDPVALQWVLNALEETGPADPAFTPVCAGV